MQSNQSILNRKITGNFIAQHIDTWNMWTPKLEYFFHFFILINVNINMLVKASNLWFYSYSACSKYSSVKLLACSEF